jgi:hypothetical protein
MEYTSISCRPFSKNLILIGGLLLYACAFAILLHNKNFEVAGALIVLVVFGIVLPAIAWIATRRAIPLSISIKPSKPELIVLIGYIIALSFYLIGGPQWIDRHLPSPWIDSVQIKFFITLAHPCGRRSTAELRQLRPHVVLNDSCQTGPMTRLQPGSG